MQRWSATAARFETAKMGVMKWFLEVSNEGRRSVKLTPRADKAPSMAICL